jgi:heat shock protein HslJ
VLVAQIAGAEWRAARLTVEGKNVELAADHRPTFAVDETGRVQGLAALNRYFGELELEESGEIRWAGPLGSTRMAGPEPLMDQENAFLHALQSVARGSLRDGRLILEDTAGQNWIEFER